MTAQSIGIFTIVFPDPYEVITLKANNSFQFPITDNIRTLSAKDVERGNDPYGILFVPNLSSDACKKSEQSYLPSNITRLHNLPTGDYALIAFAPWFSGECMKQYFSAARATPVKAFIVYQPGDTNEMPPVMNDQSWYLADGGSWKVDNKFPAYAISSTSGKTIAQQLGQYSGNITDVPNGEDLASEFGPMDYVRLWATVNTDPGSQLPSLWVFLVIVLGLLIVIIGSTSILMHMVQRRRRNALRQRVINGEVDLEALGVKRLTVPRSYLEKLPLYPYSAKQEPEDLEKTVLRAPSPVHDIPTPTIETPLSRRSSAPEAVAAATHTSTTFSQSTCPICLDDFEPNESQVRELPCRHIFHVDCIDPFLLSNSSLCPLCKQSALPPGCCPARITNVMVRRERIIRRMRNNGGRPPSNTLTLVDRLPGAYASIRSRVGGISGGRRIFSAPSRSQTQPADLEMAGATSPPPVTGALANSTATPEITPAPAPAQNVDLGECVASPTSAPTGRREWARQRAMALLGNHHVPSATEDEETTGPRWKRGLRKVFPGFR